MTNRPFDTVCEELERSTEMSTMAARGTVRIALKEAGLDAQTVSRDQLFVVVKKVMPNHLERRGVADESVIDRLAAKVAALPADSEQETPEAVFARLGGPSL